MSIFKSMSTAGMEAPKDSLGGFSPLKTAIHLLKVKAMFAGASEGGAQNITVIATLPDGKEYRETVYITNKKGEHWFMSKGADPKKVPLPGFTTIDHICLMTTGKGLADQDVQDKIFNVYDKDQKKEVPKSVPMLVETIGKSFKAGILEIVENKNSKVGDAYVATAEERRSNAIDKVFHETLHLTVAEGLAGATTTEQAEFYKAWAEKNDGQVRDKRTFGKTGAAAGAPGAPAAGGLPPGVAGGAPGAAAAPKKLFG